MTEKRKYDSTVARMAGNIAPALLQSVYGIEKDSGEIARLAVKLARAIVAETERTEPARAPEPRHD